MISLWFSEETAMLAMANRQYRSVSPSRLAVEEGAKRARKGSEESAKRKQRAERERENTSIHHSNAQQEMFFFNIRLCLSSAFPLPFGSNPTRANDSMGSKMPIFNIRAWLRTLVAMFAMAIAAIRSHLC